MKKFVRESLYENLEDIDDEVIPEVENDEDVVVEDDWETPEKDEIDDEVDAIDASDMEVEEIVVDDDDYFELQSALDAELQLKEFNRTPFSFRVIPKDKTKRIKPSEVITGIVMAKLQGNNYIIKTDKGMRKFNVKDIVLIEEVKTKGKKQINEILKNGSEYEYVDYLFDIATFLLLHPENVQAILNIHNVNDEEEAKIDITNELEDHDEIYGTKAMYDAGIEAEEAALQIVNQYQG